MESDSSSCSSNFDSDSSEFETSDGDNSEARKFFEIFNNVSRPEQIGFFWHLPDAIILHIFSLLKYWDLISCRSVCAKFYQLSLNKVFWSKLESATLDNVTLEKILNLGTRTLYMDHSEIEHNYGKCFKANEFQLNCLHLEKTEIESKILMHLLRCSPHLNSITLNSCDGFYIDAAVFRRLASLKHLQKLVMLKVAIFNTGIADVLSETTLPWNLKYLILSFYIPASEGNLQFLEILFKRCSNLVELELRCTDSTNCLILNDYTFRPITEMESLQVLKLNWGTRLSDTWGCSALEKWKNLKTLCLREKRSDELLQLIRFTSHLEVLDLKASEINYEIIECILQMKNLRKLSFYEIRHDIDFENMSIFDTCSTSSSIHSFTCTENFRIPNEEVRSFLEKLLSKLSELGELNLNRYAISEGCLHEISKLKCLQKINLQNCKMCLHRHVNASFDFENLKKLHIRCSFENEGEVVETILKYCNNVSELQVDGNYFTKGILEAVASVTALETLALEFNGESYAGSVGFLGDRKLAKLKKLYFEYTEKVSGELPLLMNLLHLCRDIETLCLDCDVIPCDIGEYLSHMGNLCEMNSPLWEKNERFFSEKMS